MNDLFNKLSLASNHEVFRGLKEYTGTLSETVAADFRDVFGLDTEVQCQIHENIASYKVMNKKTGKQLMIMTVFLD